MRRELELKVPSILRYLQGLRNTPVLNTTQTQIRHIKNPSTQLAFSRTFTTSRCSLAIVKVPIRFAPKHQNDKNSSSSASSSSAPTLESSELQNKFIILKCFHFIHKEFYSEIVPFLEANRKNVSADQVESILKELEIRKKFKEIINIHKLLPALTLKKLSTLKLLLRCTYASEELALYEIVFAKYLESDEVTVRYCNMALKAVIANRNLELAKQLLYQMIYSHLPMNSHTVEVFLKSVRSSSGNFQTFLFVVDLLEKNPKVPVEKDTYSLLMSIYAKHADSYQIEKLIKFLEGRKCDLKELELYRFCEQLKKNKISDYGEVWTFIEEKLSDLENNTALKSIFYHKLVSIFVEKSRLDYTLKVIQLFTYDGMKVTDAMRSKIVKYFSKSGDIHGLISYLTVLKDQKQHIQPLYVYEIWRATIKHDPNLSAAFTYQLREFLPSLFTEEQLNNEYLMAIKLEKATRGNRGFNPVTPHQNLKKRLDFVRVLIKERRDMEIIDYINDELRTGCIPEFLLVSVALAGLIKMNSPHSTTLYKLGIQLHKDKRIDFDLQLLRKELHDLERSSNNSEFRATSAGVFLVGDFKLKHSSEMNSMQRVVLANLASDIHGYKAATDILVETLVTLGEECKNNIAIYTSLMRSLYGMGDKEGFLSIIKMAEEQEGLPITRMFLKRLKTYSQRIQKRAINGLVEEGEWKSFEQKFNELSGKVVKKFVDQIEEGSKDSEKSLKFLDEWNKNT